MAFSRFTKSVEVFRIAPPLAAPPLLIERVAARALELGLPEPSLELIGDAYAFLAGGQPIERMQMLAGLQMKYRHSLPWFARPFAEMIRGLLPRIQERNERVLSVFKCLRRDMVPGSNSEQQVLSTIAICHYALTASELIETSISEILEIIQEIVQLPRELNDDESTLFECFPPLTKVEELPEELFKQFVDSKTDPEVFFLGETLKIERALGSAITEARRARRERRVEKGSEVKNFAVRELLELEQLLTERGKLILLRMYHQIKSYRCFSQIRVKKFKLDPDGREVRSRRMRNISEMHKVRQTNLLPLVQHPTLFWLDMLQNKGKVRERGVRSVTKRLIYVLIDRSLSMLFHGSMFKAGGVLYARLLAVIREDAILKFRFFDGSVHSPVEARDPADAQAVMGMIRRTNFLGSGGTDLNLALRTGITDINNLCNEENVERPQMLVVTDDKVEVTLEAEEFGEIELHAFICHGKNPSLKSLARSLGGLALEEL